MDTPSSSASQAPDAGVVAAVEAGVTANAVISIPESQAMQPLFRVPSRNTMRSDILDMHVVQRKSMVKYFQQLSSRVAITTDIWTANHQKKSYMAVSAHYIDEKWELKSFLLRFIYVPAPHTAEVVADVMHEVLVDCHLERKISIVTPDNFSTNDSMMMKMQDKLPLDSLMLDGSLLHMRCCCAYIEPDC